jgi:2-methylisocitrate lyase-like PEP mutase family enzyme
MESEGSPASEKKHVAQDHIETLRKLLAEKPGVLLPGAANALSARIIADLGFEAIYLTGAGLTNMYLRVPDLAFMDLSQLVKSPLLKAIVSRIGELKFSA